MRETGYLYNGLRVFGCQDFSLIFYSLFYPFNSTEVTEVRRGMRLPHSLLLLLKTVLCIQSYP